MKKIFRHFTAAVLAFALLFSFQFNSLAAQDFAAGSNSDEIVVTRTDPIYSYYWEITSNTPHQLKFGAWRTGPTGRGPATLSITNQTGYNRSFTATISGEYPIGLSLIGVELGVVIGQYQEYATSYSIEIPAGERRTITFRPKIQVHKIVQTYFRYNNYTGTKEAMDTKTAYVDTFIDWDYDWHPDY